MYNFKWARVYLARELPGQGFEHESLNLIVKGITWLLMVFVFEDYGYFLG